METNLPDDYRLLAQTYTSGVKAVLLPEEVGGFLSAAPERLEEQAEKLAPVSEQLTQAFAAQLNHPDPMVRAEAETQLLAKALVDLQMSQTLLETARFEEGEAPFMGGVEPVANAPSLQDALTLLSAKPQAAPTALIIPSDLPAARVQLSQMISDVLASIEQRSSQAGQSSILGLVSMGLAQVAQSAGIVGMGIAKTIGMADKVTQLYTLFRQFFVNAYNSVASLMGQDVVNSAASQVLVFVNDVIRGEKFAVLVEKLYQTQTTRDELDKLVAATPSTLEQFITALQALNTLKIQFDKQADLMDKLLTGVRFIGGIPVAALPQGQLLLGATYIVIAGFVILSGADYVDAPTLQKLDRIPGARKTVSSRLAQLPPQVPAPAPAQVTPADPAPAGTNTTDTPTTILQG